MVCGKMIDFFGFLIFLILPIMSLPLLIDFEAEETNVSSLLKLMSHAFVSLLILLWKAVTWRSCSVIAVGGWTLLYYYLNGGFRRRRPIVNANVWG